MSILYVSDLDGTLLGKGGTLSDYSRNALCDLLADGLPFSVASARSVASMRPVLDGVPLTLPVIELNGAFITDLRTGRHEVVNAIAPEVAEDIHRLVVGLGHAPLIATFDGSADCVYHREVTNDGMRWYVTELGRQRDRRLRRADDLAAALAEDVVCITIIGEAEPLAELETALRERHGPLIEMHFFANPYSPGWHWLTVHDRRATKAQGVRTLVEMRGLHAEELIVFGDEVNDIKIFEIAAHAVAVANAHPALKRIATHLIGPHDEDSVVKYMHEHWGSRDAAGAAARPSPSSSRGAVRRDAAGGSRAEEHEPQGSPDLADRRRNEGRNVEDTGEGR